MERLLLTADHDGVIVADVVAEWARRHGQSYRLELTGPAGGSSSLGTGGEEIVMDAVDFCRIVSGRLGPDGGEPWGLLITRARGAAAPRPGARLARRPPLGRQTLPVKD